MANVKKIAIAGVMAIASLMPAMSAAKNGFLVAPGRLEIDVDQLKTHSFIITNTGDDRIRLSIEPIYLPIDDKTMKAGKHLNEGVEQQENIADRVRVSPRRLSLNPGQRRDVRVQIRPLTDKPEGDYRAHLLVKMEESVFTQEEVNQNTDEMSINLNIKMETAVALYGRKGDPNRSLSMKCEMDNQGNVSIHTTNPTVWRFEGRIASDHTKEKTLVVLRESTRTSDFKIPTDVQSSVFKINNIDGNKIAETTCTEK